MTDQQVLLEATVKAVDNGWSDMQATVWVTMLNPNRTVEDKLISLVFSTMLQNHDFAKSLFGEGKEVDVLEKDGGTYTHYLMQDYSYDPEFAWQYHLQQMVISPDPIDYLRTLAIVGSK